MVLYIKNMEFETVGVIDTAESVIWRETYVGCGDFELYLVAEQHVYGNAEGSFLCHER